MRASTRSVPRASRFEYWRSLHAMVELEACDRDTGRDFHGERLDCTSAEGITFGFTSSARVVARFGTRGSDTMVLARMLQGQSAVRFGGNAPETLLSDGFALLDHRRPYDIISPAAHAHLYMVFPRRLVLETLGENPLVGCEGSRALPGSPLFSILWSHLQTLAREGETFNAQETAAVLRTAADLALTGLAQLRRSRTRGTPRRAGEALVATAERIIRMRCGDSELTSDALAASLGVSRAHLYRVFAGHGFAVGDAIREARLAQACRLLSAPPFHSIGEIAHRAGYSHAAAFSRAFRRRFGLSPRDWAASMRETGRPPETESQIF